MFQCIANCWRGWAQCSNAIVTDLAFNVYRVPYLQAKTHRLNSPPVISQKLLITKARHPPTTFSGS